MLTFWRNLWGKCRITLELHATSIGQRHIQAETIIIIIIIIVFIIIINIIIIIIIIIDNQYTMC
jgi:uncharacterized membrane protein affecting hemolysin expression